jgi:hypothetical protein
MNAHGTFGKQLYALFKVLVLLPERRMIGKVMVFASS